jgi:isochorismate synthase
MMTGFALYRLPYADQCTVLSGEVQELKSLGELNGCQGFVMAPFAPAAERPILVIRPDRVEDIATIASIDSMAAIDSITAMATIAPMPSAAAGDGRADYHIDFANFHAHLLNGDFQKLVLSRSVAVAKTDDISPIVLFQRACERYPRMFVSLVYTPQGGLWLTATPEILLQGDGSQWQTIALAGTMPYAEEMRWGDKDIQEQRYVATYITHQLERFTGDFSEQGPYTARAGHLAHLRSDFRFTLSGGSKVGELLAALHPTPAVCGLPKLDAFRFILSNEHHDRTYYSGFMGSLSMHGQTSLFVTLRCMRIFQDGYRLYAGGGLLKDSVEEQEWHETEIKLDTMRNLIKTE